MIAMAWYVPRDDILIFPAYLVAQPTNSAVLSSRLQSQDSERLWDNHALFLVVRAWDSLEDL